MNYALFITESSYGNVSLTCMATGCWQEDVLRRLCMTSAELRRHKDATPIELARVDHDLARAELTIERAA